MVAAHTSRVGGTATYAHTERERTVIELPCDTSGRSEPAVDSHLRHPMFVGGAEPQVVRAAAVDQRFEPLGRVGHPRSLPMCLAQSYAFGYTGLAGHWTRRDLDKSSMK